MTDASADAARKPADRAEPRQHPEARRSRASRPSAELTAEHAPRRSSPRSTDASRSTRARSPRPHEKLAVHDQSDYAGLGAITSELQKLESTVADLEVRWLEVSELLEG